MANSNVLLDAASVQVIDLATNTYRVNSGIGTITLQANVADYESFKSIASGAGTVLTLPQTTVWFLYVKNLDLSALITVQVQVTGGTLITAANSPVLNPGGVYIYANSSEGAPTGGIVGVTLVSNVGNTAVELLTAG